MSKTNDTNAYTNSRPIKQIQPPRSTRGQLVGLTGNSYMLESKAFSSGGEGDIFNIVGNNNQVVKIYHPDRISLELEQKLKYMAINPPEKSVLNQVAWPMDVVYDEYMQFKGFVMPKLDITAELGDVYKYPPSKPESRLAYNYKIILAINICTVINAVHNAGYVFGDFNPRNIGINMKTGRVAFLDTDSYHIVIDERANKAYRCKVCLDGYVAPELLKQCEAYKTNAYENAPLPTFTKETDNFALAIHIFRLLMNGYTPFNGIKQNETVSTASPGTGNQAIKRDNYCFKAGNKPQAVAVPPATILPDKIKRLFDRAFIDGRNNPKKRPNAQEWYSALSEYEKMLVGCSKNPSHMFKKGLSTCPWCDADERYQNTINPQLIQRTFPSPVTLPTNVSVGSRVVQPSAITQPTARTMTGFSSIQTQPSNINQSSYGSAVGIASVLYPISWIIFLANICFCFAPFVSNGSISFANFESIIYNMDYKLYTVTNVISVALLCFSDHLKNAGSLGSVCSWIWGIFAVFGLTPVAVSQMGYGSNALESGFVKFVGIYSLSFIVVLVGSAYLGDISRIGPNVGQSRSKSKFRFNDVIFLLSLIGVTSACILLLLNLAKFFSLIISYNVLAIAFWITPIVFLVVYRDIWKGKNTIITSWFSATMAVLFDCAILTLALVLSDYGYTFLFLLLLGILAILAIVFIAYLWFDIDISVSRIVAVSFFAFFFGSAYTAFAIGLGVPVGEGARFWTVAPVVLDVISATIYSVVELVRK